MGVLELDNESDRVPLIRMSSSDEPAITMFRQTCTQTYTHALTFMHTLSHTHTHSTTPPQHHPHTNQTHTHVWTYIETVGHSLPSMFGLRHTHSLHGNRTCVDGRRCMSVCLFGCVCVCLCE